jgi:hypothetical protein
MRYITFKVLVHERLDWTLGFGCSCHDFTFVEEDRYFCALEILLGVFQILLAPLYERTYPVKLFCVSTDSII